MKVRLGGALAILKIISKLIKKLDKYIGQCEKNADDIQKTIDKATLEKSLANSEATMAVTIKQNLTRLLS